MLLFLILCTCACTLYIGKRCTIKVKDRLQPDNAMKKNIKNVKNVEKRAPDSYMFGNREDVEIIVTHGQDTSTESKAKGQVRVVPDDSKSKAKAPTGSSLTVAKFVAEKVYIGLKDKQYGDWFREMVQKVIQKATEPASTHNGQPNGLPNANSQAITSQV